MAEKWFISDTHFFHGRIIEFRDGDNKLLRTKSDGTPFKNVYEMNEYIAKAWRKTVGPNDKVYHLGDVAFSTGIYKKELGELMYSLPGNKYLCVGNHDEVEKIGKYFDKASLWFKFNSEGFFASHVPIPVDQFRCSRQLHGHTHAAGDYMSETGLYQSACVEMTDYFPVHVETVMRKFKEASER